MKKTFEKEKEVIEKIGSLLMEDSCLDVNITPMCEGAHPLLHEVAAYYVYGYRHDIFSFLLRSLCDREKSKLELRLKVTEAWVLHYPRRAETVGDLFYSILGKKLPFNKEGSGIEVAEYNGKKWKKTFSDWEKTMDEFNSETDKTNKFIIWEKRFHEKKASEYYNRPCDDDNSMMDVEKIAEIFQYLSYLNRQNGIFPLDDFVEFFRGRDVIAAKGLQFIMKNYGEFEDTKDFNKRTKNFSASLKKEERKKFCILVKIIKEGIKKWEKILSERHRLWKKERKMKPKT